MFKWSSQSPCVNVHARKHNIITHLPSVYPAKQLGTCCSHFSACELLFTEDLLTEVILRTNVNLSEVRQKLSDDNRYDYRDFDSVKFKDFLGILMFSSVFKSNREDLQALFATDETGRDIFRCTIGYIYSGKDSAGRTLTDAEKKLGNPTQSVLRLSMSTQKTNRNVTAYNWFSSIELVLKLKKRRLTHVGTLKKNKIEVPKEFLLNQGKRSQTCMDSQKNKAVLLVSSMHHTKNTDPSSSKPEIIEFYNSTKGGIDAQHEKCTLYSTSRRTIRVHCTSELLLSSSRITISHTRVVDMAYLWCEGIRSTDHLTAVASLTTGRQMARGALVHRFKASPSPPPPPFRDSCTSPWQRDAGQPRRHQSAFPLLERQKMFQKLTAILFKSLLFSPVRASGKNIKSLTFGAALATRLWSSPSTVANRVRFPTGSLPVDIFGDAAPYLVPTSPSLKTAMLRAAQNSPSVQEKLGLAVLGKRPFVLREYVYVDELGRLDVNFKLLAPLHSILWGFMGITGLLLRCSFQPRYRLELREPQNTLWFLLHGRRLTRRVGADGRWRSHTCHNLKFGVRLSKTPANKTSVLPLQLVKVDKLSRTLPHSCDSSEATFSGFPRGFPVFPTPSFRHRSIFTSITLIGSQDLAVKSRPNLFAHSHNATVHGIDISPMPLSTSCNATWQVVIGLEWQAKRARVFAKRSQY
ncbi:hypothetical protein PR048_025013 [Dryococelus australis]|uniref:PiggyBac transposable element-derived protein domain-containing protein n=1 Tax=Dryococelus australis TaxID=614101 RepID=A0ABQ9GQ53_9NEOP|nr:hypothetical protein PR048_025013 [Dryococelus australis]